MAAPPLHTLSSLAIYIFYQKYGQNVVHGSDPFDDALKRHITTIPPSFTTTHHDGGLLSPLSYTLADDNPPLPSTGTQRSRQNLRERNQFCNDGWTRWEAMQLADELEAGSAGKKPTSNGKLWIF
jgi:hypothetical protein